MARSFGSKGRDPGERSAISPSAIRQEQRHNTVRLKRRPFAHPPFVPRASQRKHLRDLACSTKDGAPILSLVLANRSGQSPSHLQPLRLEIAAFRSAFSFWSCPKAQLHIQVRGMRGGWTPRIAKTHGAAGKRTARREVVQRPSSRFVSPKKCARMRHHLLTNQ